MARARRRLWRWVLVGVPVGGVAGLAAWSLVAGDKSVWGIGIGVAAALATTFAPSVASMVSTRWQIRDEHVRQLAGLVVAELPKSMAGLLRPDAEVIEFFGRDRVLAALAAWCGDGNASPVRLVVAPGGYGKSRLARQFGRRLSGGWTVHPVAVGAEAGMAQRVTAGAESGRLVLLVDYAESRDPAGLAALLCAAARTVRGRVRVLLLARTAGPWWSSLSASYLGQAALVDALTVPANVIELEATADGRAPKEIVASAVEQFADHLRCPRPATWPRRAYPSGTPLLRLHAEALVAVLGGRRSRDGRRDVLGEVLGHETRYWRYCARRAGISLPGDVGEAHEVMAGLVGLAALVGADTDAQVAGVVRREPTLAGAQDAEVAGYGRWLRMLYPVDTTAGQGGRLGTLQPDLLAEHLAVQVLARCTEPQRVSVFTGLSPGQAVRALTMLGRAASTRDVGSLIESALTADVIVMAWAAVEVARQFPGVFADRLATVLATADIDDVALRELAARVPYPSVELHRVAVVLTGRITDGDSSAARDRAEWLHDHAIRLAQAGRRAEALKASAEAVNMYRQLAAANRNAYLPRLATSVNNHAANLADAGQHAEALQASGEAVKVYWELAAANRDAYLPGLATSVNNHAIRLAEAGRRTDALQASAEAVRLRRELLKVNRDAYLPDLATSVNNHAVDLAEAGRRTDALQASAEAVRLRRELVETNRDAYLPGLATSVNNHAANLAEAGRHAEALQASAEAFTAYRKLTTANPDAYLPDLAASLNNHAIRLAETGRWVEALKASEEAVRLRHGLAEANPDAHLPDLAASLNNHAIRLAEAGRWVEALKASEEAVRLRHELAEANPDAHLPDLAASLWTLGWACLLSDEPTEKAIAACTEAVKYFEHLAAAEPDTFIGGLHSAARTLADLHTKIGNNETADTIRAQHGL